MAGRNRKRYTFIEEHRNRRAKISLTLGLLSLGVLAVLILIAFSLQGRAGIAIGAVGLAGAVLAIWGFATGLRSLSLGEDDLRFSALSTILTGVLVIVWGALVLLGLH